MTRDGMIAALGADALVRGFALAGVRVVAAEDDDAVRSAWRRLPADVSLVILTAAAARALGADTVRSARRLTVVMPG